MRNYLLIIYFFYEKRNSGLRNAENQQPDVKGQVFSHKEKKGLRCGLIK